MCTVLLPPGINPTTVKYISYHIIETSSGADTTSYSMGNGSSVLGSK